MNVSKRLLSEVLGEEYSLNEFPDGYSINYKTTLVLSKYSGVEFINIHELAHKCKEWAYQNYSIMLESAVVFNASGCKVIDNMGFCVMVVDAKTEPEAIFKACDYILKELSNK